MSQAAAAAADGPVPAALRLEYAAPADGTSQQTAGRRRWRVISLIALSPGLILPFLPMDCDLSAATVLWKGGQELLGGAGLDRQDWGLWLLAMPYFLIFPLFVWKVRQL